MISANSLFLCDCMALLERLPHDLATIVYLDPPWDTSNSAWSPGGNPVEKKKRLKGSQGGTLSREYASWLARVLQQAQRIARFDGNVVLHTDSLMQGQIRLVIADFFPEAEIIEFVIPRRAHVSSRGALVHDSVLLWRMSANSVHNTATRPLREDEIRRRFPSKDKHGLYCLSDLATAGGTRGVRSSWHGFSLPSGRSWRYSHEKMDELLEDGRIKLPETEREGLPRLKLYLDETADVPVSSVWDDVYPIMRAGERAKFPTQKPLALMERVVTVASNPDNIVVDPFCGSGTTLVASSILGRKWIACDSSTDACNIAICRLEEIKIRSGADYVFGDAQELARYPVLRASDTLAIRGGGRSEPIRFVRNERVPVEETRHYEFKEVKGNNPVSAIENTADEYAVAYLNSEGGRIFWGVRNEDGVTVGVSLTYKQRDDVRKAVTNKLAMIRPAIAPTSWRVEVHDVFENDEIVPSLFVVELVVPKPPETGMLFATGNRDCFVKTDSGRKRLDWEEMQAELIKRQRLLGRE